MTIKILTITEFLLARIAEDEAAVTTYCEVFPSGDMAPMFRRVLSECKAKRALVGLYEGDAVTCDLDGMDPDYRPIAALASVYSDHPDYRAEWA